MSNVETKVKSREQIEDNGTRLNSAKSFLPKADIREYKDSIVLEAEMPGADESSVDITLEKNVLTVTAAVVPAKHEGYKLAYAEYPTGDYKRSFTLPNEIDRNGIEAQVKNGVLKLTLPKSKDSLPKKITVTGG